jgi:maleylpyruvate isomerase
VPPDLASDPVTTIGLCQAAHTRLLAAAQELTDDQVHDPSRLPSWSIGHVLTHVARNADGHALRLDAALQGENLPRYPGGSTQRNAEIAVGAERAANEIVADLSEAQARLDRAWARSVAAGWPHSELLGSDNWPTTASPSRRLREVEVHHVDLGIGYEPSNWPEEYVRWELPLVLATVPDRVENVADMSQLVAWLSGRAETPGPIALKPWSKL